MLFSEESCRVNSNRGEKVRFHLRQTVKYFEKTVQIHNHHRSREHNGKSGSKGGQRRTETKCPEQAVSSHAIRTDCCFSSKLDAMGNDKKKWFIHTINTFYNSKHKCAHMCQPSDVRPRPVPSIWICWEELCVFCLPKPHPLSTSLLSSKRREKPKAEPI